MEYKKLELEFIMAMQLQAASREGIFSEQEQKTIAYYDNHAKEWEARRENKLFVTRWQLCIDQFHKFLPTGKILEIGVGDGREAQVFVKLGYNYIGTDVSDGLLKVAQERNPTGIFINTSVYSLPFEQAAFDGFWAAAVLLHIPRNRIDVALASIRHVVKHGAIGFISLKEGDGDFIDDATGRHFTLYRFEEFVLVLQRNGFMVERFERKIDEHCTWLCFYVQIKQG